MADHEPVVYEFGPFQLDVSQRLLFCSGKRLPVSPKALTTLVVLVSNSGQLVEKADLLRLVWPGAVVEEANLAVQISQLRKLLGEVMTTDPIETIPKRGYRFVAPVKRITAVDPPPITAPTNDSMSGKSLAPSHPIRERALQSAGSAPRTTDRTWLFALALLVSAVIVGAAWRTRHPASPMAVPKGALGVPPAATLTERDSILVSDIQNQTGETVFDGTLRQALIIQLEQSPFLSLVSDQRIRQVLNLMQQPSDARLTPTLSWELCKRADAAAVIDGSIARLGTQYVLGMRAVNCHTGESLFNQQETAVGQDHILHALDDAATALRARLGESLAQLRKYNRPLEEATTASLPALEAYSQGWLMNYRNGDSAAAIDFFHEAVRLDPGFSMAHAALGQVYANLYEPGKAADSLKTAYEHRQRVSERERFYIESRYQRFVVGDLEKARLIQRQWAEVYPRDAVPITSLALIDRFLGQYERALAEAAEALRLSPDSAQSYANLSFGYLLLNRLGEAQAVAAEAQAKHLDSPLLKLNLYFLAHLQNDRESAERLERWSVGQAGVEDRFLQDRAFHDAFAGRMDQAKESSRRAIASSIHAGARETAAGYAASWAVLDGLIGNEAAARSEAGDALQIADDRDSRYDAAVALALAGALDRAESLGTSLARQFPNDTAVQSCYLPTLRAILALRRGDAGRALQALEITKPYELGKVTTLLPVYVRGQAYLAARRPDDAILEFQKIRDWPGVVGDHPIGALVHLQLARAHSMRGSADKARESYREFLTIWKEAAPTIPVLEAARSEYAWLSTH